MKFVDSWMVHCVHWLAEKDKKSQTLRLLFMHSLTNAWKKKKKKANADPNIATVKASPHMNNNYTFSTERGSKSNFVVLVHPDRVESWKTLVGLMGFGNKQGTRLYWTVELCFSFIFYFFEDCGWWSTGHWRNHEIMCKCKDY